MDIKYTIEILTKDIQDIEKLVGKLQNSKDASAIELDLAMSKIRNLYEILTMIKADRLNELVGHSLNGPAAADSEAFSEPKSGPQAGHVSVQEPPVEPVPEPEPEAKPEAEAKPEPEIRTEHVSPGPHSKDAVKSKVPEPPASKGEDATILAEKFRAESSINENLADTRGEQLKSKLIGQPIDNIARNIGINDRFLIIRELFDGNSEDFNSLITNLDTAESFQSAKGLLEKQFAGSMEHQGVEILTGLVKRRYLR